MTSNDQTFAEMMASLGVKPLTRKEQLANFIGRPGPNQEQMRESARNARIMWVAAHILKYGLPKGTPEKDVFAEHHKRRCQALKVPLETSDHALLLLEHGYPREKVLELDRQGAYKSQPEFE